MRAVDLELFGVVPSPADRAIAPIPLGLARAQALVVAAVETGISVVRDRLARLRVKAVVRDTHGAVPRPVEHVIAQMPLVTAAVAAMVGVTEISAVPERPALAHAPPAVQVLFGAVPKRLLASATALMKKGLAAVMVVDQVVDLAQLLVSILQQQLGCYPQHRDPRSCSLQLGRMTARPPHCKIRRKPPQQRRDQLPELLRLQRTTL